VLTLGLAAGLALAADEFPTKPIRIIVPAGAAGGLDVTTRLVAQKMSENLGQSVIVENQPGADTMIGTRNVKAAPADGYTILAQAPGFSLLPHIKLNPGFDPVKDFTGLGNMVSLPMLLIVGADQPDRTAKDIIARARTSKVTYATGGPGTPQQLAMAKFLLAAGVTGATEVPYKGAGPAMPDIAAGRVDMAFDVFISTKSMIEAGKFRVLGVTTPKRIQPLPNIPTFTEQGYNFTHTLWLGLVVPTGTPKAAIQRLSMALKFALESKELSERFRSEGSDPTFTTPEEWTEYLRKEYAEMGKLAADLKFEKQ
jgi:tripartite-type tricarboxylate transporter receptor subunit TctC